MFTFVSDVVVLEEVSVIEHDTRTMRNHLLPVCFPRRVHRSLYQAEVSSGVVHADVEEIAIVVWVILDVLAPRFDDLPLGQRLIRRNVTRFAGSVTSRNQKDVAFAACLECFYTKALVLLFIDQLIGTACAHNVAIQPVLPFRGILHRIEHCLVVVGPNYRAGLLDVVGQQFAGAKVFHGEGVLAKTGIVG